jgi:ABC-type Fe3+ transport system permease subunit
MPGWRRCPPGMRQAGLALGLRDGQVLRSIELPLAAPTIFAGIKTAAVLNVGMATVATFIGAGGLGERIVAGLAVNDTALMLAGAVPAAVLALLIQWAFDGLQRLERLGLRQVAQEAQDQRGAHAQFGPGLHAGLVQAVDDRLHRHAARRVGLRVEEHLGVHHVVGRAFSR